MTDLIIQEFLSTSRVTAFSKKSVPDHLKFGLAPSLRLFAESLIDIYQNRQLRSKNFLNLKILELLHLLNGLAEEQQLANFLFHLTLPKKRNIKTFMEKNFDIPLKKNSMKISFIGLGIMGSRMAANLLKNGVVVTVYNRSQEPVEALKAKGAKAAASAQEAVAGADLVFSMLSTPEVVEKVFLEEGGALFAMQKNAIWADCSTVNPSFSLKAGAAAEKAGIHFMDTPVAGTKPQAENAELAFFVGAEKVLLEKVAPYLQMMGSKVLHIGEMGKAASFKMLVNMMLAQSMIIFSEAVLLGEKMGISKEFLLNVVPNLAVAAPFTKAKAEMVRANDYELQFPLELMQKDLHLAAVTAYEMKQPLFLANLAKELFAAANKEGMGRMDFSAIYQYLEGK